MRLTRDSFAKTWKERPDGRSKVTGQLKYLTDLSFPKMIHGAVLRSRYPHAKVLNVSVERARAIPGVLAVLTSDDVPGLNRFGIVIQDQPVFCEERVRYIGDAIAAVAAENKEIMMRALAAIEVHYVPLPVLDSVHKALASDAIEIHESGNILHRSSHRRGNTDEAFSRCDVIIEETYKTPRQLHAYMETEGGVFVPEDDGEITVYAPTQHGYGDRLQLARILGLNEEKIRVVSSPIGGSFGGKDELNIQPYGALLALATGRPVKIHQSRQESVRTSIKRHPMHITMKTGADSTGKILAHRVRIIADTGAYATLGPAVLDFAVEHAAGPYLIENLDTEGMSVYTNNGVSGEFRGFGGNQVTFALEGQLDRLAAGLGTDPVEIRRINLRDTNSWGPLGQRIVPTAGAKDVLRGIANSTLWNSRGATGLSTDLGQRGVAEKFRRKGTGMAITMHGGGLGLRRPDDTGGRIALSSDGKVEVAFGLEECGQGIISSIPIVVCDAVGCSHDDVRIIIGDTTLVPPSGSSTASRATGVVWQSLQRLKKPWVRAILAAAGKLLGKPIDGLCIGPGGVWSKVGELAHSSTSNSRHGTLLIDFAALASKLSDLPSFETTSTFPMTPDEDAADGAHYLYSFAGVVAQVEVDLLTGSVYVSSLYQSVSAGPVINPMGYLGQIEGGGMMGLGFTLFEDVLMERGEYITKNLDTYLIPGIGDLPKELSVDAIEHLADGDSYGPRGVGEIGTVAVAPAIISAIHDAIGYRVTSLPIQTEEILRATAQLREDVFACL